MDDARRRLPHLQSLRRKVERLIRNFKPKKRKGRFPVNRSAPTSPHQHRETAGTTSKAKVTEPSKDGEGKVRDGAQVPGAPLVQHGKNRQSQNAGDTAPVAEPQDRANATPDAKSAPRSDAAEQPETWFDDKGLENTRELKMLWEGLSTKWGKNTAPDGVHSPELDSLVKSVENPPTTREDLLESIGNFGEYIKHMEEKTTEKARSKREAKEHAKRANELQRATGGISPSIKNTFKLIYTMLEKSAKVGLKVAESTLFVADALTNGTYYQVAVKAILLFVNAYKKAKTLMNDIIAIFDELDEYRQKMTALLANIKSAPMSKAISKFFVSIMAFVTSAGSYLEHGMLPKMAMQLGGCTDKFQDLMDGIKGSWAEVWKAMKFAEVMMSVRTLENTKEVLKRTADIQKQLEMLNKALPPVMSTQLAEVYERTKAHAELHIQAVREQLFGGLEISYEPSEEMLFNKRERIFLAPRERWQRQLLLNKWPRQVTRPLIWITGHLSRRNVSWVSSFAVDFVDFFRSFSSFDVAYIFCKRGLASRNRYGPTLLIKGLIAQLMDMYPTIALSNVRQLSLARFRAISDTPETMTGVKQEKTGPPKGVLAWQLLEHMLWLMDRDEVLEQRGRQVLLIVDRLDLCMSEEGFSVMKELIPRLQQLGHQHPRVQVIITTAHLGPYAVPDNYLKRGSEWLVVNNMKFGSHR
ncbi:hypothetical protein N0V82_009861 [Gnomoniopsis sp. IMI 355080]|nr:hypothetical protein N0V82_009861 [Gnomoniopsis sp. IMI 355080]